MDLQLINLSINPTYLCNFRCDFCYLTTEQLADKKKIDLNRLIEMLKEIKASGYRINHTDLYGGEIGLLPEEYLKKMKKILRYGGAGEVSVITNLSKIHPYFLDPSVDLSVSFDFEAREKQWQVVSNIAMLNKPVAILMLASPKVLAKDVDEMIKFFNQFNNIVSVEIKPYSTNQSNVLPVTDRDFEEFIKKWITSSVRKNFTFVNKENIKECLGGSYNAYSDNHVYITPSGNFGVLEFDKDNNEYFLELKTFKEYLEWTELEKNRVNKNSICKECPYLGRCLTEHYRDVKSLENSCNGFRGLLDWAGQNLEL